MNSGHWAVAVEDSLAHLIVSTTHIFCVPLVITASWYELLNGVLESRFACEWKFIGKARRWWLLLPSKRTNCTVFRWGSLDLSFMGCNRRCLVGNLPRSNLSNLCNSHPSRKLRIMLRYRWAIYVSFWSFPYNQACKVHPT